MTRRVVLTCRSCKFILATRACEAELFGWRFEDARRGALCPDCVTRDDDASATPKAVAPPLGLVRQSTDAWHGELLRLPAARFLRLERGTSPRARVTAPAAGGPRPDGPE